MLSLAAAVLLAASDHLAPEADLTELGLFKVLLTETQREVQMVTMPAEGPSEAVFVARGTLYAVRGSVDGKRSIVSVKLPDALYPRLKKVWARALRGVREPETKEVPGGTLYHFADWNFGEGYRAGQTWAPVEGTRNRVLVSLGEALSALARGERDAEERLKLLLKVE